MDIVEVLTKVTQEQQRALQEQERVNREQQKMIQAQQNIITGLKEKFIPELSHEFKKLKQEVRVSRTTALAN